MAKVTQAARMYFERMLTQAYDNKLTEGEVLQLYQDMANTGYAWENQEHSIHCRMLMDKKWIEIPEGYNFIPVSVDEIIWMRAEREKRKHFVN